MKLQPLHLFIILIGSLIFCTACVSIREGMTSTRAHTQYIGPAGDTVDVYANDSSDGTRRNYKRHDSSKTNVNGVYSSQIPPGNEDLYILKSQIVPPVCPACPTVSECPRQKPCSPCPPCGRCPEPSFECKKVPNYAANNDQYLPRPVLSDFSQFGM